MKESIMILMLVTTGFFCSGQSSTDSVYTGPVDPAKAKVAIKSENRDSTRTGPATEMGTVYNASSTDHNDLHRFTYLTAMRDYCNKTLLRMRDNGEVNKKLSKKLEKELSKAKTELASAKFNGLKIESDYYQLFLKKINDQFRE